MPIQLNCRKYISQGISETNHLYTGHWTAVRSSGAGEPARRSGLDRTTQSMKRPSMRWPRPTPERVASVATLQRVLPQLREMAPNRLITVHAVKVVS
jgi:hypothetical protein